MKIKQLIKCLQNSFSQKTKQQVHRTNQSESHLPTEILGSFNPYTIYTLSSFTFKKKTKERLRNFISLELWLVFCEVLLAFGQKYINFN